MSDNILRPYMFEPRYLAGEVAAAGAESETDSESDREPTDEGQEWRVGNVLWCSCHCCVNRQTAIDSVCCQEIKECCQKMDEDTGNDIKCITDHSKFHAVCILRDVLKTALVARNDIRRDTLLIEPLTNESAT